MSPLSAAGRLFAWHPEVEVVSRDRCGLYAQGASEGAPQALQVTDRFHLLQNLRATIDTQLSRTDRSTGRALLPASASEDESSAAIVCSPHGQREVAEHRYHLRQTHRRSRQVIIDRIHALHDAGKTVHDIAQETGFGRRSIKKWLDQGAPADRQAMAPKPSSPAYYQDYLARRWAEGCVRGRDLFEEIRPRGYNRPCRIPARKRHHRTRSLWPCNRLVRQVFRHRCRRNAARRLGTLHQRRKPQQRSHRRQRGHRRNAGPRRGDH
jgi:hypothetical protein